LNIALVSDWYYPRVGGIEYAIDALARNLKQLGHGVHLFSRRFSGALAEERVNDIPVRRFEGNPISEHLITAATRQHLRDALTTGGYDIVHAHGMDSPMAMTALRIAREAGLPSVITSHSQIGNGILKWPMMRLARCFVRHADAVIAVSSVVEQEARTIAPGAVYRIPNGIDTQSPNGAVAAIPLPEDGRPVVATVARMTKRKGVQVMVEVALALLNKGKDLFFMMIGGGPLQEVLEKRVKALGFAQNFLFTGNVSRGTVLRLLERAQVFALPSTREAFGISVLEAFMKRVPVVAMAGTGVSDLVVHGKTGLLAADYAGLGRGIETLLEDRQWAGKLAAAAFAEIENYRWPRIAGRTVEVYADVRGKKGLPVG
jgi:glycosyltransferase involved in cell wall biosynthesis